MLHKGTRSPVAVWFLHHAAAPRKWVRYGPQAPHAGCCHPFHSVGLLLPTLPFPALVLSAWSAGWLVLSGASHPLHIAGQGGPPMFQRTLALLLPPLSVHVQVKEVPQAFHAKWFPTSSPVLPTLSGLQSHCCLPPCVR